MYTIGSIGNASKFKKSLISKKRIGITKNLKQDEDTANESHYIWDPYIQDEDTGNKFY